MGRVSVGQVRVVSSVAALIVGVGLGARGAHAQTIDATVTLEGSGITHSIPRTGFRLNTQINRADCVNDDIITFPVVLTNRGTSLLEVWAGTSCDDFVNRTTVGSTLCWKLASFSPTTQTPTLQIHVRSILAGYTERDSGLISTSPLLPPVGTVIQAGSDACIDTSGLTVVSRVELYFMLVDPSTEAISGTFATWAAGFKLLGPLPPDTIGVESRPKSLAIDFGYFDNQSNDTTINGYTFFCDPPPGAPPADVGPDAGSEGACAALPASTALVQGITTADPSYLCGTASLSATSALAKGLVNDAPYHVAMAATDTYENIGPLSTVACGIPRAAEQTATACSFAPPRATSPSWRWLALLGLTLPSWRRSLRRARARDGAPRGPRR